MRGVGAGRRAVSRTVPVVAGLLLLLPACSGSGDDVSGPADRSTAGADARELERPEVAYPEVVRRARMTDGDLLRAPPLPSSLPKRVEFPPSGDVTSVVDDPPGRAVLSIVNIGGEPGPTYGDLSSYTWYLYGLDGRWRVFELGSLGLADSERADLNVVGQLSPDGRYASLMTDSALLIMNLHTGRVRSLEPERGRTFAGGGKWTPDGLIAMGYSGRNAPAGVFIDPDTGRRRQWGGPSIYINLGLEYDWDGTPVLERFGSRDRVLGYKLYDDGGRIVRELELPWLLQGRGSQVFGEERIAFHRQAADGRRLQQQGALIVTDREATPEHVLLTGDNDFDPRPVAWLDDRTLLVETSTALVAWRPDEQQFYRLTRLDKKREAFYYSVATDLV